ncbi:GntR family transcriptional regulator [Limnobacter humi]|uniref:GntR family transcriptional regulator n=1 Tax=Limnobacter humi TaxID=1778671 RepID=A0ABT1WDZ8_9BURK|nr:GntR family transcriptional regulator [Limnobacter humi]
MHPIDKTAISDQVFQQLQSQILSRRLPAGHELPSERQLSVQLGVNRGAIREAIKRLQQARLVKVRHGGATVVEEFAEQGGLELLPSLVVNDRGQLNMELAKGMVLLRKTLAPLVAGQAAAHQGPVLADALHPILQAMQATTDLPTLQQLAFDYWSAVVAHSGNVVFRLAFNSMNETYRAVWGLMTHLMQDEFRDVGTLALLAEAFRAGEVRRCEVLTRQHVELGSRALQNTLNTLSGLS